MQIDRAARNACPSRRPRFRALVLGATQDGGLKVGMADPTDLQSHDELARTLGCAIEPLALSEDRPARRRSTASTRPPTA